VTDVVDYLERKTQAALGRSPTAAQTGMLHKYLKLLIKWQKSQRLVGSDKPNWIVDNVIVDSLLFTRALPAGTLRLADVGSGAGVPGIPLAVVLPQAHMTLIEARQKRGSFLAAAIRELALPNCKLVNHRLEAVSENLAEAFDAVVMRCAGRPTALAAQVRGILAPRGVMVASGPPTSIEVDLGEWLEVKGPDGVRRFWVYHVT
jgi:16S rRNA (guanine527-N7)-methyltransferase